MRGYKPLSTLLLCISLPFALLAREKIDLAKANKLQQQQGLTFLENKGQVTDEHGKPRTDIQYSITSPGLNVYVGTGGLQYQFYKSNDPDAHTKKPIGLVDLENPAPEPTATMYRVNVSLAGADMSTPVVAEEQKEFYSRFYNIDAGYDASGKPLADQLDRVTARSYNRITYKNVYPNIDWVLYISKGHVEYDFVVRPGGNADNIKLKYDGATTLAMKDGGIIATTPMGSINEKAPITYELASNKKISSSFCLHDNVVSFNTAPYSGTLVIDPTIAWGTYFGGATGETGNAVAYDHNGNVYLTGSTSSSAFVAYDPAPPSVYLTTYQTNTDAFVVLFDSTGRRQWATYFGGNGSEIGTCIAADASGNVFIGGNTTTSSMSQIGKLSTQSGGGFPYGSFFQGGGDGFVAEFSNSGARVKSLVIAGNHADAVNGIACDNGDNVYVTGTTASCSSGGMCFGVIAKGTSIPQNTYNGGNDAFVMALAFSGGGNVTQTWGTYYGGTGTEQGTGIAFSAGSLVVVGYTSSLVTAGSSGVGVCTSRPGCIALSASSFQPANGGGTAGYDAFLAGFSIGNGQLLYGTYFGGSGDDYATGVAIDSKTSDIYMTGYTSSTGIYSPTSPAGIATTGMTTTNPGTVGFLTKFNSGGTLGAGSWSTLLGPDGTTPKCVAVDLLSKIYVGGTTTGLTGIATFDAVQGAYGAGTSDGFVLQYTSTGVNKYGSYLGGNGDDAILGMAVDGNNNLYMAGTTTSTNQIATTGSFKDTFTTGASSQAFLVKMEPDSFMIAMHPYDTIMCDGHTALIPYLTNLHFTVGNIFYAELSDATGAFGSTPQVIGQITATTSGTITASIPAGQFPGTAYRVRIRSTLPPDTSLDNGINIAINELNAPTHAPLAPICLGDTLKVIALLSDPPGTAVLWKTPQIPSISTSLLTITIPNSHFTDSGIYKIVATINGCLSDTDRIDATIYPYPDPAAITSSPAGLIACSGSSGLTLIANSGSSPTMTYQWFGPNSFYQTTQTTFIGSPTAADAGYYKVIATDHGCSTADSAQVTVKPSPLAATVTANTSAFPACAPATVTLTANSTTPGVTYSWTSAGVFPPLSATGQNITDNNVGACSGCFFVVSVNLNGCIVNTSTNFLTVYPLIPAATISITSSPSDTICGGSPITYTALAGPASGLVGANYQWLLNGNPIPGQTGTTLNTSLMTPPPQDGDLISCTITENVQCQATPAAVSNAKLVHVLNKNIPTVKVTSFFDATPTDTLVNYTTIISNGTAEGLTFQWTLNGLPITGATSSTYSTNTLSSGDLICVIVSSAVPCTVPSSVTVCGDQVEVSMINRTLGNVSLFPSPNKGTFSVTGRILNNATAKLEIVNALGQVVYQNLATVKNDNLNETVELGKVASGVYMLRISSGNDSRMIRFVVE